MKKLFTKLFVVTLLLLLSTWTTVSGQTITSTTTGGLWSATATWVGGVVPVAVNDVLIADGATVTIDAPVTVASITVGQGTSGILTFDGVSARAVVVTGSVMIATNGTFIVQSAGTFTNTMSVAGNITNNGTFDMSRNSSTTVCTVTFNGTGEQDLSGSTPLLTRFRGITLTKGSKTDLVKSTIDTYFGGSGLLLLTTGTWEQNAGNLINVSGNQTLGSANGVLLIDGSGGYTNYNSTNSNASLGASLAVSSGTFTVNTTGNVLIGCGNNSVTCITPGIINFTKGNIYISGRLTLTTGISTINGANIFIDPNPSFAGASPLSASSNTFEVSGTGGTFNFTSGSVTLVNPTNTATTGRDLKITSTGTLNITNGIIYIGDGSSTKVSTGSAIYNGFINGSDHNVQNVVVQTGNIAGRNFGLKSNLLVSGTLKMVSGIVETAVGSVTRLDYGTTGTLSYNGTAAQTTSGVEFPTTGAPVNLIINNAAGVTLGAAGTVTGSLTLTNGTLATGANTLTLNGTTTGTGLIDAGTSGTVAYNGTAAQTMSNLNNNTVNNLTISNTAGVNQGVATTVTGGLTVNTGATFKTGANTFTNNGVTTINGNFQIDEGGWATGNDFVYGAAGTLVFNNSLSAYGVNGTAAYWPSTNSPVNVTVQNTGGIQLQGSRTVTGVFQTSTGVANTFGNNLTASGTVKLNAGGYFSNFAPTYTNTSTLVYNTGSSFNVGNEWGSGPAVGYGTPQNVSIQNATAVSLLQSSTVPGILTLTGGTLTLGANNLTVGSIVGGSATNYVVTNGVGTLTQPIAAAGTVLFPIGASATSYDPATINPTLAANFSAKVSGTLTGTAASGYNYNAKEWNLSSDAPSSTVVTLTPSTVIATGVNSIIGQYDGTNYVNVPATLTGTTYSATFTTFSQFVSGATDLPTSVSENHIQGVSFDGQTIHNNSNLYLQVYDVTGRLAVSSTKNINMSSAVKGIYLIKSTTGTLKIVL